MIKAATEADKQTIVELMQDYLSELAQYTPDLDSDAERYHYPYLDSYWEDPGRYPFLVTQEGWSVGFILVRQDMNPTDGSPLMEVAEFFVTADRRRDGLGTRCAESLFEEIPGNWRACVLEGNETAYGFWKSVIAGVDPGFVEVTPSDATNHQYVFTFHVDRDTES